MDCNSQGLSVLYYLPGSAQILVHWVNDAIQSCNPLLSSSQLLSVFPNIRTVPWVGFLHHVVKVLDLQSQQESFQWILGLISFRMMVWFPWCLRDSQESSPAPQFESINYSALSLLYGPTLTSIHDTRKTIALTIQTFVIKVLSLLFNMLSRWLFLPRSKHLLI